MRYFFSILLFACFTKIYSQTIEEQKIPDKNFVAAQRFFEKNNFKSALTLLLPIDSAKPGNPYVEYLIGTSYLRIPGEKNKSINYLTKAAEQFETYNKAAVYKIPIEVYYYLGQSNQLCYKLDDAIKNFEKYLDLSKPNGKYPPGVIYDNIKTCTRANELMKHPVNMKVTNLGKGLNTEYPEYSPVISADESVLIFTSRRPEEEGSTDVDENGQFYENIYISMNQGGNWTTPLSIGKNINTIFHEASVSLSADGQHLYIYKQDDIFVCDLNGDVWSSPKKLNASVNTKYWEPSASISADNNYLYFVSDRPGGLGKRDIYRSKRLPDGQWGKAENLGYSVNTDFDEDGPFIHPDGKTLYFSSNAPNGMGGFDIYKTIYSDSSTTWSAPKNIGYPINSTDDDIFFILSASGKHGYYSSVQPGGYGEKDLYRIDMPKLVEEEPALVLMTGNITMEHNIKASIDVNVVVTDRETKELIGIFKPNSKTGKYLIILEPGREYNLDFEAEDRMIHTENVSTKNVKTYKEIDLPIELKAYEVGESAILRNLFFDTNKAELRPESEVELNKLFNVLQQNQGMVIEISGHTDNVGNQVLNQKLSESRAQSVSDYLIGKGIDPNRLKPKGFGSDKPITTNDTDEGRQENRRIEYTILKH